MPYPAKFVHHTDPAVDRQSESEKRTTTAGSNATYLLLLGLVSGGIPLLGLLRGVRDRTGRRAELLGRRLGRHCDGSVNVDFRVSESQP